MDSIDPERRKKLMSRIRNKNTAPELAIRKMVHQLGYRFRLHRKELPGTPDLVFPSRLAVIFVHGCFWHGHDCRKGQLPKTNVLFWTTKIVSNRERDKRATRQLKERGWKVLVVWECELNKPNVLASKIMRFLKTSEGLDAELVKSPDQFINCGHHSFSP